MASFQITPPEKCNFATPEEWPKWIRRFERFRQASGLHTKSEENQINTLIYAMGDEADDILTSLRLTDEQMKKYADVQKKFEDHFVKRRNTIFERAKFNQRKQDQGESVDSFITALYCLAEHCGYGELHDEMIRDRIVVGLLDASLSERLQLDPELTLDKAIAQTRQREAVKKQQAVVRGDDTQPNIDAVSGNHHPRQGGNYRQRPSHSLRASHRSEGWKQKQAPLQSQKACTRCGKLPPHAHQQCPAREAACRKFGKKGHYQAVCRTKKMVSNVQAEQNAEIFIGAVEAQVPTVNAGGKAWIVKLSLNELVVDFKIDTGADVSVVSEQVFNQLKNVTLKQSTKTLSGPNQQPLHVRGQFTGTFKYGAKKIDEEIFVVRGATMALLGRPAIESLELVARVNAVDVAKEKIVMEYPELFEGLGTFKGEYHIQLKDDAKPFALSTPRRVALPLIPKVKAELQRMEQLGVISRVDEPTDWCAGMVVVPKPNGKVRICVDLTKLNESVRRERHILPSVEQTLAQLGGAKVFSKLDANSGFWQIKLSRETAILTTFITPSGRYCFNRLPFGITSAPEIFQKRMSDILTGLEGVVCMIDDVLVYGQTKEEHDKRLAAVLDRIKQAGATLNTEKCEFGKESVRFLGQIVDKAGIRADPEKIKAIKEMKEPTSITEVRRFLGMTNQLSKFMPNLAEKAKPLRDLLIKKNQWTWDERQQQAFDAIKIELSSTPILALYHTTQETMVSADASSYGVGAVLTQKQPDNTWKPVAYASRALTPTEQRYAQIEKEALPATWACERFSDYLLGKQFHLETDHKPLVPLLGSKNLDELPIRVQRFRMRLMRFQFTVSHVAGKDLVVADALSRAPISSSDTNAKMLEQDVMIYVNMIMNHLPVTENRLIEIKQLQERDEICQKIKCYCNDGWPNRSQLKGEVKKYLPVAAELTVLIMRGNRIVIPEAIRSDILSKLHSGHQGITKCRERARQSVWWPGLSKQLEYLVNHCTKCCRDKFQHAEPLMPSTFPSLPWQKVATDLFEWKGTHYLLLVDYFSRYIEIARLTSGEKTSDITRCMKSIFARHGIPQEVFSDNGPQYSSAAFSKFAKEYGFMHITSSPRYPQSNGEAERAVKTIKSLLKKAEDPYLALLAYRSTPLQNGYSPAELWMGRRLRTTVPTISDQLKPSLPDYSSLKENERKSRERQKSNFDKHRRARSLDILSPGDQVWVTDQRKKGTVVQQLAPRSYQIETPTGVLRRNRRHLNPSPHDINEQEKAPEIDPSPNDRNGHETTPEIDPSPNDRNGHETTPENNPATTTENNTGNQSSFSQDGFVRTRCGRSSRPPHRMDPSWI